MNDPITPASLARADERRRPPAGIEDESLVDHIIDELHQADDIRYEPMSGQYWTDDLPAVIRHVASIVLARASADVIAKGFAKEHRKDARVGLYEAAQMVTEVRL